MDKLAQQLQAPFPAEDIEWRVQQSGISNSGKPYAMVLAYVTNRAIMNRLDEVFGVYGWQNIYHDIDGKAVECGIKILHPDTKEWIAKYDAADKTDIESTKGGRSNAMKRAAVQLGIGRYLYNLDSTFADCADNKTYSNRQTFSKKGSQEKVYGSWRTPDLPKWALPSDEPINKDDTPLIQSMIMANDAVGVALLHQESSVSDDAQIQLGYDIKSGIGDGLKGVIQSRTQKLNEEGEALIDALSNAVIEGDADTVNEIADAMTTATKRLLSKLQPELITGIKELRTAKGE